MRVEILLDAIGAEFFTGVPDSLLRPLCDCLYDRYGISDRHIVAANEGNAAALAAGWHLASGKTALVYLQNSGLGNLLNPAVSLTVDSCIWNSLPVYCGLAGGARCPR